MRGGDIPTRTDIDEIVREHIHFLLVDIITEMEKRGFRRDDSHHITVKKATLLDIIRVVSHRYNITP